VFPGELAGLAGLVGRRRRAFGSLCLGGLTARRGWACAEDGLNPQVYPV
jgi:hypothetical protein